MLYDPKWEKTETKIEPLSLAGLVQWLETKDPSGTYNWRDCKGGCLVGLYGGFIGREWMEANLEGEIAKIFGSTTNYGRVCNGYGDGGWTFGDALRRASAIL